MDIVKKNLLSILCGVVALICIILLFFPFGGMYADLQTNVTKSKGIADEIKRVMNTPRHWPTLSNRQEDQVPLTQFPTQAIITAGDKLTKDWTNQAQRFYLDVIAQQKAQLLPLEPRALPGPGGEAVGRSFVEKYQRRFGIYIDPRTQKKDETDAIYNTVLNAGLPPTEVEIKAEQDLKAEEIRGRAQVIDGKIPAAEEQRIAELVAIETAKVPEVMRGSRAQKKSIYVEVTSVFKPFAFVDGKSPPPNLMFSAQVRLWVLEEICRAIADTNRAANPQKGIIDSPIKRLVQLDAIEHDYNPGPPAAPGATADPLKAGATAKPTPDFAKGPFGHAPNEFYDPINIKNLVIICEAETLPQTLARLTSNRFITISDVKVESLDSTVEAAAGFLYGNKPVVVVTINAKYLMLRPFIKDFMPADIVRGVNLGPAAGPGLNGQQGTYPDGMGMN